MPEGPGGRRTLTAGGPSPDAAPRLPQAAIRLVRAVPWPSYALAFGVALLLAVLYGTDTVRPKRHWQEVIGVVATGAGTLAALVVFLRTRARFHLWGTALLAVLLCREIHFEGTGGGVYVGLLALFGIALRAWDRVGSVLERRRVMLPLAAGFLAYALSIAADQRWLRHLPGEHRFHVPLEESMEIFGHVAIALAIAWFSIRAIRARE